MTTLTDSASPVAIPAAERRPARATRVLPYAAAAALLAGPVCWSLGMLTSPPAASMADTDYVAALARNGTLTQVSALFLHYGNLFMGLGVLVAPALVRGRRGAWPTVIGTLLASLGMTNLAGTLLSDWWNLSVATHVPPATAAAIFHAFKTSSLLPFWTGTEMLSQLGIVLVMVGLARAGVLGWWTLPVFAAGFAGLIAFGNGSPILTAAFVLVGFAPLAMIGFRTLQRLRVERG